MSLASNGSDAGADMADAGRPAAWSMSRSLNLGWTHGGRVDSRAMVTRLAWPGVSLLRDTDGPDVGPVITFTAEQWTAFLAEVTVGMPSTNGVVEVIHTDGDTQVHGVATGVRLRFTQSEWAAFRAGVRDGEFDLLAPA